MKTFKRRIDAHPVHVAINSKRANRHPGPEMPPVIAELGVPFTPRGHPRLRMRHAPFGVGPAERDRWLVHMRASLAALAPPDDIAIELDRYFGMAAEAMRNRD